MQARSRGRDLHAAHPSIGGIGLAAHETERLEAVDVVRDRGALELDVAGERRLADQALAAEGAEHHPGPQRSAGGGESLLERRPHRLGGEDQMPAERLLPALRRRCIHLVNNDLTSY